MVTTLDNAQRIAIATKLADMKVMQDLLIWNEQQLISAVVDDEIRDRLKTMMADDRKNMGVLDTVIIQYGVQAPAREKVKQLVEQAQQMTADPELSLYEKVTQHELLKHQQVMAGLIVHKAAQITGADVEAAIVPLNTVNFENRAHQEQLKGVMEILGVRELTGQDAKQGIWARVQDAVAALSGVAGSVMSQMNEDMEIQDIIRLDHNKVNMLFMQIEGTSDPKRIEEYFGQLYKDLTVHAQAEEQVVYPAVRSFYSDTQELYDEQAEMKVMLEALRLMSPTSPEFKRQLRLLKDVVMDHVRQEESTLFAALQANCNEVQREQLAADFKAVKSQLQQSMATEQPMTIAG